MRLGKNIPAEEDGLHIDKVAQAERMKKITAPRAGHRKTVAKERAGFPTDIVDNLGFAVGNVSRRIFREEFELPLQLGRQPDIVRIAKSDELAGSHF